MTSRDKKIPSANFLKESNFVANSSAFSEMRQMLLNFLLLSFQINRVIDETKPMSRNILSLMKSKDAIHWEFIRDVVDCSAYENAVEKIGMQYPDLIIDDEDLIWVQRTAMNNATNYHDSNYITFHRMKAFRRYIYADNVRR